MATQQLLPIDPAFYEEPRVHGQVIYQTTYKKSGIMGQLHFSHPGTLSEAISAVKEYLSRRHLRHIHTAPFLVDLTEGEQDI